MSADNRVVSSDLNLGFRIFVYMVLGAVLLFQLWQKYWWVAVGVAGTGVLVYTWPDSKLFLEMFVVVTGISVAVLAVLGVVGYLFGHTVDDDLMDGDIT